MKKIELIALWFDNYKCFESLNNSGIPLNFKYDCIFEEEDNNLNIDIKKNDNYNIFPDNLNIITIVGSNGSGKTTILNMIKAILANQIDVLPQKYCLLLFDGENFIYKKSANLQISTKQHNCREFHIKLQNGYNVGDKCNILMYKPFLEKDFNVSHSKYYNSYDNELKIQDQINKYFVYDRLDENVVAFSIGRTINNLKNIKFFKEYKNIVFDEFGWEFNLKDCYEHIINRLRKKLKDSTSNKFPMTFGVVLHNSKYLADFYELINKIVYFKDDIYEWDNPKLNLKDVFQDIFFFSAILEFEYFLENIEISLKEFFLDDMTSNINNPEKLSKIEQQKTDVIDEILKNIIDNTTGEISTAEFLKLLISIFDNKSLKYNNYLTQEQEMKPFRENIRKVQSKIDNINLYDILNTFFDKENLTFKLKKDNLLSLDKFLNQADYEESTDDFSAIYMYKYSHMHNNEAIKTICDLLPEGFIGKYFNINLYKSINNKVITFKDLSTGEQRILKFFADILYCNPRDLYLFDEIDMSWHPEWQRHMISLLVELFQLPKYQHNKINLILTTHSPIILSDIPDSNIIVLKRDAVKNNNPTIVTRSDTKTFAANIYALFKKPFVLKSSIGDYAEYKLRSIIKKFSEKNKKSTKCVEKTTTQESYRIEDLKKVDCEKIINLIGEDLTKKILLNHLRIYNETDNQL